MLFAGGLAGDRRGEARVHSAHRNKRDTSLNAIERRSILVTFERRLIRHSNDVPAPLFNRGAIASKPPGEHDSEYYYILKTGR